DMGRNIFQSETPLAMMKAVNKIVHENYTPAEAFEYLNSIKAEG
ncbi:MAG: 3-hydroxy-5-phosphonooxypentane-2,4-dione thiolase LsrF, partial [Chlorobiaceae bacterium]|nr:3-hydroxy-5-phosphonooxypentane-2,4-dione thiolase LsrF [Chlorobiaceae bacterium]